MNIGSPTEAVHDTWFAFPVLSFAILAEEVDDLELAGVEPASRGHGRCLRTRWSGGMTDGFLGESAIGSRSVVPQK